MRHALPIGRIGHSRVGLILDDGASRGQFGTIEVGDDWALVGLRGRYNKRRLCQTIGRAQHGTIHAEGIQEGIHGRLRYRL